MTQVTLSAIRRVSITDIDAFFGIALGMDYKKRGAGDYFCWQFVKGDSWKWKWVSRTSCDRANKESLSKKHFDNPSGFFMNSQKQHVWWKQEWVRETVFLNLNNCYGQVLKILLKKLKKKKKVFNDQKSEKLTSGQDLSWQNPITQKKVSARSSDSRRLSNMQAWRKGKDSWCQAF